MGFGWKFYTAYFVYGVVGVTLGVLFGNILSNLVVG